MKALTVSLAVVAVVSAQAQTPSPSSNITGSEPFCLKAVPEGNANCIYVSIGTCETAKKAVNSSGECVGRAQLSGTTGSGATTGSGTPSGSRAPTGPRAPSVPPANPPAEIQPR